MTWAGGGGDGLNTETESYLANPLFVRNLEHGLLKGLYRFSNDIPVHSISTGCPTLTQSRWAPSCHTWRGTNLTWQKWVGTPLLLIKMGKVGKKTSLKGRPIKEKAWGLFHSCFAHWPESSGVAGNGVIGSKEVRPTEGHFTLFRVLKKHTSRTAHTRGPFWNPDGVKCKRNQMEESATAELPSFTFAITTCRCPAGGCGPTTGGVYRYDAPHFSAVTA